MSLNKIWLAGAAVMGMALFACGDSDDEGECRDGSYVQCYCESGASGLRQCVSGRLGACVCADADGGISGGTDGGSHIIIQDSDAGTDAGTPDSGHSQVEDDAGTDDDAGIEQPDAGPQDPCLSVTCDAWEECAASGDCVLSAGRCEDADDCTSAATPECNTQTHYCVASLETDPCVINHVQCDEWKSCVDGDCRLNSGRCDAAGDCKTSAKPVCNVSTHTCEARCASVVCNEWESCVESTGRCKADSGRCSSASDCANTDKPVCNTSTHNCQTRCASVTCDEWKPCAESSGRCTLSSGRCDVSGDCTTDSKPVCNTGNHYCEAPVVVDPCESAQCGTGATCSNQGGTAVCSCPHGQWENNGRCQQASIVVWCGIHWVDGWTDENKSDPEVAQGSNPVTIYAWVYDTDGNGQRVTGVDKPEVTGMKAQVGYTTASSVNYPIQAHQFVWVKADYNSQFSWDSNQQEYNNHEYMGAVPTSTRGTYRTIFRFSKDNGATWAYCDKDGFITSGTHSPVVVKVK